MPRDARFLVSIHAAAPDLDPLMAFDLAQKFSYWAIQGASSLGVEIGLAFAPWRGDDWALEFRRVVDAGFLGELAWHKRLSDEEEVVAGPLDDLARSDIDDWIDEGGIYQSGLTDAERLSGVSGRQ